jgi:hypothetical protein
MQCPSCGSHQSSDSCKLCGESLIAKKAKSTGIIPPKSEKREKEEEIYKVERVKFLEANPKCAVYPKLKAVEIHHKRGRTGDLYLDQRFWLAVSKKAHHEITTKHQWAIDNGYSELRLKTT